MHLGSQSTPASYPAGVVQHPQSTMANGHPNILIDRSGSASLGNWQAPVHVDQVTLQHAQISFLQKSLGEEVQSHNDTRVSRQNYRDASLGWERNYYSVQTQLSELNSVVAALRERVQDAEMKRHSAETETRGLRAEYDRLYAAFKSREDPAVCTLTHKLPRVCF